MLFLFPVLYSKVILVYLGVVDTTRLRLSCRLGTNKMPETRDGSDLKIHWHQWVYGGYIGDPHDFSEKLRLNTF